MAQSSEQTPNDQIAIFVWSLNKFVIAIPNPILTRFVTQPQFYDKEDQLMNKYKEGNPFGQFRGTWHLVAWMNNSKTMQNALFIHEKGSAVFTASDLGFAEKNEMWKPFCYERTHLSHEYNYLVVTPSGNFTGSPVAMTKLMQHRVMEKTMKISLDGKASTEKEIVKVSDAFFSQFEWFMKFLNPMNTKTFRDFIGSPDPENGNARVSTDSIKAYLAMLAGEDFSISQEMAREFNFIHHSLHGHSQKENPIYTPLCLVATIDQAALSYKFRNDGLTLRKKFLYSDIEHFANHVNLGGYEQATIFAGLGWDSNRAFGRSFSGMMEFTKSSYCGNSEMTRLNFWVQENCFMYRAIKMIIATKPDAFEAILPFIPTEDEIILFKAKIGV